MPPIFAHKMPPPGNGRYVCKAPAPHVRRESVLTDYLKEAVQRSTLAGAGQDRQPHNLMRLPSLANSIVASHYDSRYHSSLTRYHFRYHKAMTCCYSRCCIRPCQHSPVYTVLQQALQLPGPLLPV
jgi:hypothetical protein